MSFLDELEWRFRNINEAVSFILAILSLAIVYIRPSYISSNPILFVLIPIATATIAIVPHEIAHRQSARNYGCASRFVLSFKGFLLTLLINLISSITGIGFVVFASGYTAIMCRFGLLSQDLEGKTALAGPVTNLAIALISIIVVNSVPLPPLAQIFLLELFSFNSWVAFFNLIPVPPLDGFKVFRWNRMVWLVAVAFAFFLTFFVYV
ncbi:MAG: peptidase M50 [Sulfolobus sp.]